MKIWKYIKFVFYGYWRVPKGDYCYDVVEVSYPTDKKYPPVIKTKQCPYWKKIKGLHHQEDGYCNWLERGDCDMNNDDSKEFVNCKTGEKISAPEMPFNISLLWDGIKECNLKHYSDKEIEKAYEDCMKLRK